MIGKLNEVAETLYLCFAESPLGKKLEEFDFNKREIDDSTLADCKENIFTEICDSQENTAIRSDEVIKNCPVENGTWDGERGNSKWIPDAEYMPQKKNPEQKKWGEILEEHEIDGISFKEGEPDFSEISKANVEIESFSANRDDNFDLADMKLAEEKGYLPGEVAKWRKENSYTWHECKNMKTMEKVPSNVHNNISHRGGISEIKGGYQ